MARINLEDCFWADPRFTYLSKLLNDDLRAIGACIRLWRIAQSYSVRGELLPESAFNFAMLPNELFDAGFAERRDAGIYVKGADEHFSWLLSKVENGKIGGIKSGESRRSKINNLTEANRSEHEANRSETNPLTLTPSPALRINTIGSNENSFSPEIHASLLPLKEELNATSLKVQASWLKLYSPEFIIDEIRKANIWVASNSHKAPKSQWARFYSGWLLRGWEDQRKRIQPAKPQNNLLDLDLRKQKELKNGS